MEPEIDGVVIVSGLPAGSLNSMFTVTGTSTAGLNSTMQNRGTLDPTGRMGLIGSLVTVTEVGAGTACVS